MTLFPNGKWLVCPPTFFEVIYEINPWMSVKRTPAIKRTQEQWKALHHTLLRLGAWLEYVDPHKGLPDMVFTANAGLVKGKNAIVSKFKHPERQGEERHFEKWFIDNGYETALLSKGYFEGEGDALFSGDRLFCGHGFRSDRDSFFEVQKILNVKEIVLCELVDPRFYHLDTCFCPITPTKAIFFPAAFTKQSITEMQKYIELIPIPESDAVKFACNSVVLNDAIITPSGCSETKKILEALHFEVHQVELDEFMKGGGASKCLVCRL